MVDLKRAREIAWHFAERAHDTQYNRAGVNFISIETEYELADTIRDLVDAVEFWKNDSMESGKLYQDLGQVMGDEVEKLEAEVKRLREIEARVKLERKNASSMAVDYERENTRLRTEVEVLSGPWDVKQKRIEQLEARLEASENLNVEEAMRCAGGFFGPRSEMEKHQAAEIERLNVVLEEADKSRNYFADERDKYRAEAERLEAELERSVGND